MRVEFRPKQPETARVSSQSRAKNLRQMALVGEPDFQGDRGQRLSGAPHQGFCPLDPPFGNVALGPRPTACLNERLK
jgi:hypothetical protein